nr:immunoglobulin light chain junction region [Macaca mulatta]
CVSYRSGSTYIF